MSRREIALIEAPSNLGLRPPRPDHEPGTWRAPSALHEAGLPAALSASRITELARPTYRFEPEVGTRIRNGLEIRAFSERLADAVRSTLAENVFPVVVGGDCSILLGCLWGARAAEALALIHIDGHSDFFHPGNYDTNARLGSAAGMDLALATGRGERLLAFWDEKRLVEDGLVVQIGEREETDPDYAFRDIERTSIRRLVVRDVLELGIEATARAALFPMRGGLPKYWIHVDVDVLDQKVCPAVDSPGSPGLDFQQLADLLAILLASDRAVGLDLSVFDPELDPDGRYASEIVECLRRAFDSDQT